MVGNGGADLEFGQLGMPGAPAPGGGSGTGEPGNGGAVEAADVDMATAGGSDSCGTLAAGAGNGAAALPGETNGGALVVDGGVADCSPGGVATVCPPTVGAEDVVVRPGTSTFGISGGVWGAPGGGVPAASGGRFSATYTPQPTTARINRKNRFFIELMFVLLDESSPTPARGSYAKSAGDATSMCTSGGRFSRLSRPGQAVKVRYVQEDGEADESGKDGNLAVVKKCPAP
jgi:hypothetical protein